MNNHFQIHKRSFKPPIILNSTKRACFPLKRLHAKKYFKNRVILLGDAGMI
jgi:2-polyprenyl-6-methoxyphenol hydroxylase-like FAD-dependent oxidoreductase